MKIRAKMFPFYTSHCLKRFTSSTFPVLGLSWLRGRRHVVTNEAEWLWGPEWIPFRLCSWKKGKNPLIIFAESILSFLFSATLASNYELKAGCFFIYIFCLLNIIQQQCESNFKSRLSLFSSKNFATMATWRNDFSSPYLRLCTRAGSGKCIFAPKTPVTWIRMLRGKLQIFFVIAKIISFLSRNSSIK